MKKIFLCAAAVAMLGLASCSNKSANAEETAAADTVNMDTVIEVATEVAVDSINPDSAQVTVEQAAVEAVTPAAAQ